MLSKSTTGELLHFLGDRRARVLALESSDSGEHYIVAVAQGKEVCQTIEKSIEVALGNDKRDSMTWTTEKPTKSGFYWFRGRIVVDLPDGSQLSTSIGWDSAFGSQDPVIVPVDPSKGFKGLADENWYDLDYADGEWSGPIEPPSEHEHNWIVTTTFKNSKRQFLCVICDARKEEEYESITVKDIDFPSGFIKTDDKGRIVQRIEGWKPGDVIPEVEDLLIEWERLCSEWRDNKENVDPLIEHVSKMSEAGIVPERMIRVALKAVIRSATAKAIKDEFGVDIEK